MKKIDILLLNFDIENSIQPWVDRGILYIIHGAKKIENVNQFYKSQRFDLIFLRISDKVSEGFRSLNYLKETSPHSKIIVISENPTFRSAFQYVKKGADDFRMKFGNFFDFANFLTHSSQEVSTNVIKFKFRNIFRKDTLLPLLMAVTDTALACLMKTKGQYETIDHVNGVSQYVRLISEKSRRKKDYSQIFTQRYIGYLYFGSRLHDIGKINVPEKITMKPYSLTKREFEIVKTHTHYGYGMLSAIEQGAGEDLQDFLLVAKEIALYHHENYDGTGYPYGLKGDDIPLSARVCALADSYEALSSDRRYRRAFSHGRILDIILHEEKTKYDPDILQIFRQFKEEFKEISSVIRRNREAFSQKRIRIQCAWCNSVFVSNKWLPYDEVVYGSHVICPECHKKLQRKISSGDY